MHRRRRSTAGVGALFGALALIAGLTSIAAGTSYINLTTAGAHDTDTSGGVWVQGVAGAGTGTFDPFLTVQATPSETGVNVCDDAG